MAYVTFDAETTEDLIDLLRSLVHPGTDALAERVVDAETKLREVELDRDSWIQVARDNLAAHEATAALAKQASEERERIRDERDALREKLTKAEAALERERTARARAEAREKEAVERARSGYTEAAK